MSMKIFCLILLLFTVGACSTPPPVPVWTEPAVRTIDVRGIDEVRLFELSRTWFVRYLNSPKPIIEFEDRGTGTIVANSEMAYPAEKWEEIERIQYTVSFRVVEKISGGRITLHYVSPTINVPKYYSRRAERLLGREYFGGYSRPPQSVSEIVAVEKGFDAAVEGLHRYLQSEGGI